MPAVYPGAIPDLPGNTPTPTDTTTATEVGGLTHAGRHDQVELEVEAIAATLGVNPQGGFASVVARLDSADESLELFNSQLGVDPQGPGASVAERLDRMQGEIDAAGGGGGGIVFAEWTTPGTYTSALEKPAGAQLVRLQIIGGGASGGGGALASNGPGGGGGNCGQLVDIIIPASALGATETVVVGAGGAQRAGQTESGTGPTPGNAGGDSSVGGYVAKGGTGSPDGSRITPDQPAGCVAGGEIYTPQKGGNGGSDGGAGVAPTGTLRVGPTSGGGGGSRLILTHGAGADVGAFATNPIGYPTAGATGGAAGGTAGAAGAVFGEFGRGGAGGGANASGAGGAGGAGASPGGGGGGGGAGAAGGAATGGAGGAGGNGRVRVWWYC